MGIFTDIGVALNAGISLRTVDGSRMFCWIHKKIHDGAVAEGKGLSGLAMASQAVLICNGKVRIRGRLLIQLG
jgi:hypothetical protein